MLYDSVLYGFSSCNDKGCGVHDCELSCRGTPRVDSFLRRPSVPRASGRENPTEKFFSQRVLVTMTVSEVHVYAKPLSSGQSSVTCSASLSCIVITCGVTCPLCFVWCVHLVSCLVHVFGWAWAGPGTRTTCFHRSTRLGANAAAIVNSHTSRSLTLNQHNQAVHLSAAI